MLPVFILNNQLPAFDSKYFSTAEICYAAEKTCGFDTIEGAQRIGGLWRIYPCNDSARQTLLIQGFSVRGVRVDVKDKNPFLVSSPDGAQREIPATKLIINNVPLSFSDEEILRAIKGLKDVSVRSKIIAERDRDENGKLTRWKTGRRFLYISVPATPLPSSLPVGPFKASLFYKEQSTATRQAHAECRKCLEKGHRASECTKNIKCRQCYHEGHKAGAPECQLTAQASEGAAEQLDIEGDQEGAPGSSQANDAQDAQPFKEPLLAAPRGRAAQRRKSSATRQGLKGQSKLKFSRSSSRSTSSKRPHPEDNASPQGNDKQPRIADSDSYVSDEQRDDSDIDNGDFDDATSSWN
jgi:hypothetical protein